MALDFTIADQAFQSIQNALGTYGSAFATGNGATYTMWIIGFAITWEAVLFFIRLLADGGRQAVAKGVHVLIYAAIVGGVISQWSTLVVPTPLATADELVQIVTFGQSPAGLGASLTTNFGDAFSLITGTIFPSQQPVPSPTGGQAQSLWSSMAAWWDSNPVSSVFVGIADSIVGSLMALACVALLAVAFATTWGSLLSVDIAITVALALGPLMLGLSIMSSFRQLMMKWISFVGGMIILKPILAIIISISMILLQQINNIAAMNTSANTPQALIMTFVLLFLSSMLIFIQKAPAIAEALFGGLSGGVSDAGSQLTDSVNKLRETMKPSPRPSSAPNNQPPPMQ